MPNNGVNDPNHHERKDDKRMKLDALRHGSRDDRRGCSGEYQLEEELGPQGHASPVDRAIDPSILLCHRWTIVSTADEKQAFGTEERIAIPKHQSPADHVEGQGGNGEHDEILGENIDSVLTPRQTGLD